MSHALISDEDKNTAFEFIILNLLIRAIQKDINLIEQTPFKLGDVYKENLKHILKNAENDLLLERKKMYKRGIKVLPSEYVSENFIRYPYLIRGHNSEFSFFLPALKTHVHNKLKSYIINKKSL